MPFARNGFAYLLPCPSSRSLECCRRRSSDGNRRTLPIDGSNLSDRTQSCLFVGPIEASDWSWPMTVFTHEACHGCQSRAHPK